MRISLLALAATALLPYLASAQTAPGFQRTASGTEYKLFRRDAAGRYQPRPLAAAPNPADTSRAGKFLLMHIAYLTERDSVLQSSRQQTKGQAVPIPMGRPFKPGSPEEMFAMLTPGDSAVFRFQADSLFKGRPVPPELKRSGNVLVLHATAVGLVDQATAESLGKKLQQEIMATQQREAQANAVVQTGKDNAAIAAYLAQNKLAATAKKTPGGTTYIITERGTGALPQAGQTVSVKYRGTILQTGNEFDSTAKHGDVPFDFMLGQGQVIQGWDQGIAMLPKGSKATLLIPSALGYGARGAGPNIPPNSALRFDVELVDIKGTATAAAPVAPATKKSAAATAKKPVAKKPVAKKPVKK